MNTPAIVIFCFNRPSEVLRLFDSLKNCLEFQRLPLYVFIDGARNAQDYDLIEQTVQIVASVDHPTKTVTHRDRNLGLKSSLRQGISQVLQDHSAVIVLEDDLVLGRFALEYFLGGLERFREKSQVVSICGYAIGGSDSTEGAARFLPMTHPWGWATWQDRWAEHMVDSIVGPVKSPSFQKSMNVFGLRNYSQMLRLAESELISSWWIYWQLFAVNRHLVSLFPRHSQVVNEGVVSGGTHSSRNNPLAFALPKHTPVQRSEVLPDSIFVDFRRLDEVIDSREMRTMRIIGFLGMVRRRLKRAKKKLFRRPA